jgi:hypothetical protein
MSVLPKRSVTENHERTEYPLLVSATFNISCHAAQLNTWSNDHFIECPAGGMGHAKLPGLNYSMADIFVIKTYVEMWDAG